MNSIRTRNDFKKRLRDVSIQRHLLSYARSDVDQMIIKEGDDDIQSTAALAQVGQRILTALRNVRLYYFVLIDYLNTNSNDWLD